MKDGLYLVDKGAIYGAFVVREGKVTVCAPILARNLEYYKKIAKWIKTDACSCAVPADKCPGEPTKRSYEPTPQYPPVWRNGFE